MAPNAFVLKTKRELCHPKSFGTFEKRASRSDNLHGRPMSSYEASSLFYQAKQANLRASYLLPIPNPSPAKIRLHRRRLQGHYRPLDTTTTTSTCTKSTICTFVRMPVMWQSNATKFVVLTTNSQKTKVSSNFPNLDAILKSPIAKNNVVLFWRILKFVDTRNLMLAYPSLLTSHAELSGVITKERNVCLESQG